MNKPRHTQGQEEKQGGKQMLRWFIIGLALVTVVAGVLYLDYLSTSRRRVTEACQVLADSAEAQAAALSATLEGQYETLEVLAANLAGLEEITPNSAVVHLRGIIDSTSFLHLFYLRPDGLAFNENGTVINVSQRSYFQQVLNGQRSIEKLDSTIEDGSPRFMLAVPLYRDGAVSGAVLGCYDEQRLGDLLLSTAYGGQAYTTICNADGNYILGTDNPNFLLTKTNLLASLDVLAASRSRQEIQVDLATGRGGEYVYELGGETRYVVYTPLNITSAVGRQWFSFTVLPGRVVDAEVREATRASSLLYLLVMAASVAALLSTIIRERHNAKVINADRVRLRISEEQFRAAISQGGRSVARYDIKSGVYSNQTETLIARGLEKDIANAPQAFFDQGMVAEDSIQAMRDFFDQIHSGQEHCQGTFELRGPEGAFRWFHADATVIADSDGQPSVAVLVYNDVTDQMEKEAVYLKWQQSLENRTPASYTLFRCNLSKNTSFDTREGNLLQVDFSGVADTFNAHTAEYVGQYVYPEDKAAYTALMDSDALLANYYRGQRNESLEYRELTPEGLWRWLRLTVDLVEYPHSPDVEAYLMYENIDDSKRAQLLDKERAESDLLTGVLNRVAFAAAFDRLLAESSPGSQHALLMMDVDGFKLLNDAMGHAVGDQALIDIAAALRSVTRHGDLVGRLGGDEFLICLKDVPYQAAIEKVARQICGLVRKTYSLEVQISASIGVAVYPRDGESFDALYRRVDVALYQVKDQGKDNFAFFRPEMLDTPQSAGDGAALQRETGRRRMLIVDDSEVNRRILTKIFQNEFRVDTAEDGRSALIRLRRYGVGISVVLLDLVMPGLDGFAVLEKMRASVEMQTIPVVVVSGAEERETSLRAIKCGASDFVTKPVDPALIRLRVQSAISKAENERLRAQNSYLLLQSSEELRYRTVLESTGTVVIEYDWVNTVFNYDASISHYLAGTYDQRTLWHILLSDLVAEVIDVQTMQELVHQLAHDRSRSSATLTVLMKTPARHKHWFRLNVFKRTDENLLTDKMILTFNDVNDEVLADEKLRIQAERDSLTGLYNRNTFLFKAGEMVRAARPGTYVMSVGDVNKFKFVNDRFGHGEGDNLLCAIAARLQETVKNANGLCGRLGSDVFATLLPDSPRLRQGADSYARELFSGYPLPMELTACLGHYLIEDPNLPTDGMLDRSSLAKQTVKGQYGFQSAWYDNSMRDKLLAEQEINDQMEEALARQEFQVYLQPQYDHITRRISGAEALVRWLHPQKGLISPQVFIDIFERNGFITRLDEYVWDTTARLLHDWLAAGREAVPVSVNVSRLDTGDPLLCEKLLGIVQKYQLPISLFRLEITESLFVQDSQRLIAVVEKLHRNGFLIEMDDFGSGYSSLNILKDVPVDILKLDMRFFSGSGDRQRGGTILSAVLRMSRWLNIQVIAEGVEQMEHADFLASIGCRVIQGWLYAQAMPAAEFQRLLLQDGIAEVLLHPTAEERGLPLWDPRSCDSQLFSNAIGPAVLYEYDGDNFDTLRINRQFTAALRFPADVELPVRGLTAMAKEDIPRFRAAAEQAIDSGAEQIISVRRVFAPNQPHLELTCAVVCLAGDRQQGAVILCRILIAKEEE